MLEIEASFADSFVLQRGVPHRCAKPLPLQLDFVDDGHGPLLRHEDLPFARAETDYFFARREERRRVCSAAEVRARERLQAAARGRLGDVDEVSLENGASRALEVRAQATHWVGALRVVSDARAKRRVLGQAELSIYLRAG